MTTRAQKIKDLQKEIKLELKAKELENKKAASEKAKIAATLRIEKKKIQADKVKLIAKQKAEENKLVLANFKKYAKLINDNELLIGGLINVVNAINTNDEAAKKRLDYFRGLVPKENN